METGLVGKRNICREEGDIKMIDSKEMTFKEKQAEKLAEFFHYGQKRRNGDDFITHPRNVAKAMKDLGYGEDVVCASFLHNIEDFQFLSIAFNIIDKVFGYKVFGLVLAMTNFPKSQSYNDYIYFIYQTSEEAMTIKWQDMIDNTKDDIPKTQFEKYRNACIFLQSKGANVPEVLKDRLKFT